MTQLEEAMNILMNTFDKYAAMDGKNSTMSKTETKLMLETELPGLLMETKNQAEVDKLLKKLDVNGDCEVDFNEFVVLVSAVMCICHNRCCQKS